MSWMRKPLITLAAGACLLLLAGCVPAAPDSRGRTIGPRTPLFATEEEALAAATAAYQRYSELLDVILSEGGDRSERIAEFTTGDYRELELDSLAEFQLHGHRGIGRRTVESVELIRYEPTPTGVGDIFIRVCEDVGELQIVDAVGNSVVSPEREDRLQLRVLLDRVNSGFPVLERKSEGACK